MRLARLFEAIVPVSGRRLPMARSWESSGRCFPRLPGTGVAHSPRFPPDIAHLAVDGRGQIGDERLRDRFDANIANFLDLVEACKHYPCPKRRWIEYLGEHPEPVTRPGRRTAALAAAGSADLISRPDREAEVAGRPGTDQLTESPFPCNLS